MRINSPGTIQKKLAIHQPGDDHEQEADKIRTSDANARSASPTQVRVRWNVLRLPSRSRIRLVTSLFLLGGISGFLGVLMRSIFDFVGHTCYKNTLDWHRWRPWYVARPVLGFALGIVCMLFIGADLFRPAGKAPAAVAWWVGVAILAGFGADDFVKRLRLLSQTLFGRSSKD
jgi:hypothetical protein